MDYRQAVKAYQDEPTKENLNSIVGSLVSGMTLNEKIYMLSGHPLKQVQIDLIKTGRNYNVHALPAGGCKRLGIPPVLFTDGPRGVVMGNSTCFPSAMLRASTFDPDIEYRIGKAIADEAIAQGANYFAGICINLVRHPRWGRAQESYGEDPFVLGEFGSALTKSVQEEGMIACPKHFALNSIEDLRFSVNVKTDDRTLHEVYLPHFKKCIDAGADSIMGAYNRYDEFHCCENKKLLTDILRDEWGFDGFVMSDFVKGVYDTEHSLRAGLDVEMMFTIWYSAGKIKKCLKKGAINEEHLNRAAENILRALIRNEPRIQPRPMSVVGSEAHRMLALEAAEKGMVLLENNGVLPLPADTKLTVCGEFASEENTGDHGSSRVYDKKIVTPRQGIAEIFPNLSDSGDVAVVCAGFDYRSEGEYFANPDYSITQKPKDCGGDRMQLRLAQKDVSLIKSLKQSGKKVIVVLYSGCAILIDEWKEYADAVIQYYYGGCEGGTALANLLSGRKNFSGRLPFTIAQKEEDYPPFRSIGEKPYEIEYGRYHGYTLLDKEHKKAAYPFGYGLSYTSFAVEKPEASADGDAVTVTVQVKNTGRCDGATVVQVYAGSSGAADDRPVKRLCGFARTELKAGEEKTVAVTVPKSELLFYQDGKWVLDHSYTFYVGQDSDDAMTRGSVVNFD